MMENIFLNFTPSQTKSENVLLFVFMHIFLTEK